MDGIRSTINLVFVTILTRWKQLADSQDWGDKESIENFNKARFTKLFKSAVGKEDITFDLQIFSIIELWISLKKSEAGELRDCFSRVFTENMRGNNLGLILQEVREASKNTNFMTLRDVKHTREYWFGLCYCLLIAFPFLQTVNIQYPTDGSLGANSAFCITYKCNEYEEIKLYPNQFYKKNYLVLTEDQITMLRLQQLKFGPSNCLHLYLLSETSAFNGTYQHFYRSFDGESEARIDETNVSSDEDLCADSKTLHDVYEMRKFLSFNYRNIREFAMIISDALKGVTWKREQLFALCKDKYPKVIPHDVKTTDDLYWDNVIMLLLVEMGPSDFLEQILDDEGIFNSIISGIGWRCIGKENLNKIKEEYFSEISKILSSERGIPKTKIEKSQVLTLRIKTVLMAMNFEKDIHGGESPYEESLSYKYGQILACLKTLRQYPKIRDNSVGIASKDELIRIYKDIFSFLQIFYAGVDRYAAMSDDISKRSKPKDESDEAYSRRKGEEHKECLDAFTEAAAQRKREIEHCSLSEVFEGFCDQCGEYNDFGSATNIINLNVSDKAKRLKKLITRNYICDCKKLRYFAEIELENGEKSTIFKMLENFSDKYYRQKKYLEWLDYFSDIFFFLIYNEDYSTHGLYKQEKLLKDKDCDPIYPYMVTYYKENVDRDSLKKCSYKVPVPIVGVPVKDDEIDITDQGFVVTLLSEDDFPPNTYFCIPLRYGSSDNWWINPFLVPKMFVRKMNELKSVDKV